MDDIVRFECTVKATSARHAASIFRLASFRLLHAREWSQLNDSLLPGSDHRDQSGAHVSREVRSNDYINVAGIEHRPLGWMRIEYVIDFNEQEAGETTILTRPVEMPFEAADEMEAKPTLLRVVRRGLDITASFIIETNPMQPLFGRLGVYGVQWRSLINGILSNLTPVDETYVQSYAGHQPRIA